MCPTISRGCQHSGNEEKNSKYLGIRLPRSAPGRPRLSQQPRSTSASSSGSLSNWQSKDWSDLMARDKISPSAMPVATGILIDKHRLMEGEPSQTIEVKKTVSLEDVRGELDRIRWGEAEGVEVDWGILSAGVNRGIWLASMVTIIWMGICIWKYFKGKWVTCLVCKYKFLVFHLGFFWRLFENHFQQQDWWLTQMVIPHKKKGHLN